MPEYQHSMGSTTGSVDFLRQISKIIIGVE
jgi:hypothetical protein